MVKPIPVVDCFTKGNVTQYTEGRSASVKFSFPFKKKEKRKPQKETAILLDIVGSIHHVSSANVTCHQSKVRPALRIAQ